MSARPSASQPCPLPSSKSLADPIPFSERKRGVLPIAISSAPTVGTLKGTTAQETFETLFNPVLRVSRARAKALARRAGSLRNLMEEYERLGEEKGRLLFEDELVSVISGPARLLLLLADCYIS